MNADGTPTAAEIAAAHSGVEVDPENARVAAAVKNPGNNDTGAIYGTKAKAPAPRYQGTDMAFDS
jgi:hypothetical protein